MEDRMSSLQITSPAEVTRLQAENQELKRQLAGGPCQISYDELDVQDQIGGGGFSLVYRGLWKGTPVAIKKWFDPNATDQLVQEFREEVMTLQALRHPNILQFLGACMKLPNLAMVTEHLPHSLHSVMYGGSTQLDRARVVSIAQDIARAFVYLHSRKPPVVHRDIKPANFLLDRAWRVKVCDFGLASNSHGQAGAGTPAYMAPELLDSKPYNEKVDVYAFGVLLNEMVAREVPFSNMSVPEIRADVLAGKRPDVPMSCPSTLQDIITKCWAQDAASRPSFDRVLELLKTAAKTLGN
ncbi:protein kinase domain-containing protein, partial [Haematococcus lacustris]